MSAVEASALLDNNHAAEVTTIPDSMDANGSISPEETPATMHQLSQSQLHAQTETVVEAAQRKELTPDLPTQVTPTSRAKRVRDPLTERNLNPSTPVRPTSKRPACDDDEDEPSTPTPGRKKMKASRARIVNVGRSPTASIASLVASPVASSSVGADEDMYDDDHL